MPKVVTTRQRTPDEAPSNKLLIGWEPGRGAQVGIEVPGSLVETIYSGPSTLTALGYKVAEDQQIILAGDKDNAALSLGRKYLDMFEGVAAGTDNSIWIELDRTEINATMRGFRKARDAAFGADE